MSQLQVIEAGRIESALVRQHAAVSVPQQRRRLGILLLTCQAFPQQALRIGVPPIVRLGLASVELQNLARQRLGLPILALSAG